MCRRGAAVSSLRWRLPATRRALVRGPPGPASPTRHPPAAPVRRGPARTALVIGAETFSRILDWQARGICVLFGDGAGALLLNAVSESGPMQRGILSTHLHSDGRQHDILYVDGGPSSTRETGYLRM